MAAFDLSMLDLPRARTPSPTPATTPEPEGAAREDSPTLDDAALEPAVEAQVQPEAEDVRILRCWNASLATMGELHEARPELRQECFQELEDWLRRWELLDVSPFSFSLCISECELTGLPYRRVSCAATRPTQRDSSSICW
jgi:hypothetical protein